MLHLGDIQKISGYTAPIVDVVVGGSPCQDLSVAGKRAGLDGERSGLFMEQLRIIKEMRENDRRQGRTDESIRPRYMVWENVPGAFSSNKGEDFRIVLEETAKVADENASIPMPNNGKWTTSGCILGDGWSIAWRVLDAQFWGVPQRRRRIALVADFGGQSAPEILFIRKSMSRDIEQSKPQGKETPSDASRGTGADDSQCFCFEPGAAKRLGGYVWEDLAPTLRTEVGDNRPSVAYTMQDREGKAGGGKGALIAKDLSATLRAGFAQTLFQPVQCIDQGGGKSACNVQEGQAPTLTCTHGGEPAVCYSIENHPADSRVDIDESGKVQTLTSRMGTGGGNVPMVMECFSKSKRAQTDTDYETWKESDVANTLNAFDVGDKRTTECVVALDRSAYNQGKNAQFNIGVDENGTAFSCIDKGPGAVAYGFDQGATRDVGKLFLKEQSKTITNGTCPGHHNGVCIASVQSNMAHSLNGNNVIRVKYIVRRLTPLECERLQGYPDGWTDIGEWTDYKGKVHKTSDAARYKALGNSIAIPPWKWVMKRISACYERDATLASLFDGIGGFPYIWEQINGKGTCLWASEIEEFPIAVTKKRIGEGENIWEKSSG